MILIVPDALRPIIDPPLIKYANHDKHPLNPNPRCTPDNIELI